MVNYYNISESVWFMYNNKPTKESITRIMLVDDYDIEYGFNGISETVSQNDCYRSKEELLESL